MLCEATQPVRLCMECYLEIHTEFGSQHCVQAPLPSPYNNNDTEAQHLIVEAIIKFEPC